MNKMNFEKLNKSLVFVLKSNLTKKEGHKFYCLPADADEQLSWQIQFEELLDSRKNLMRALQYPLQYSSDALQKRESKNDLCGRKSDK